MRIGLYGISGVYNFGCEAIVRGATALFLSLYPDAKITYYSYNYDYDKEVLSDLNLEVFELKIKKTIFKRLNNKIRTLLNCDKRQLFFDYKRIIDSNDVIVSIGGDIYTIPKYLRKQKEYPYYNPLVDFCERAIRKGKRVIVYGGSVGPFGEYVKARNYYSKYLCKYSLILCREWDSIKYLESIGIRNVLFFPDPAFQVKGSNLCGEKENRIAVNLSPLSFFEYYGGISDDIYSRLAEMLDRIIERYAIDILLVPHVIAQDPMDNDLEFLRKIFECSKSKEHIIIADYKGGFLGIKRQLDTCKLTIAARMHCAINSIVESVPTIFISYSQKSIGMCEYIYGDSKYVIRIEDIDKILQKIMDEMLVDIDRIENQLRIRTIEIEKEYNDGKDKIKKALEGRY